MTTPSILTNKCFYTPDSRNYGQRPPSCVRDVDAGHGGNYLSPLSGIVLGNFRLTCHTESAQTVVKPVKILNSTGVHAPLLRFRNVIPAYDSRSHAVWGLISYISNASPMTHARQRNPRKVPIERSEPQRYSRAVSMSCVSVLARCVVLARVELVPVVNGSSRHGRM